MPLDHGKWYLRKKMNIPPDCRKKDACKRILLFPKIMFSSKERLNPISIQFSSALFILKTLKTDNFDREDTENDIVPVQLVII